VTLIEDIRQDLAAFADDEDEVIIEETGRVLFRRHGADLDFHIEVGEDDAPFVRIDDTRLPYRQFLAHNLAQLDVFASRIVDKRPDVSSFIDGPATLETVRTHRVTGRALDLLQQECTGSGSPFATRVVFLTADAGHGKTVLLRHYQRRQAERFVRGHANSLFWHVDLQGRQLLRLHEALMGDVAELRVPGLWMPAVIRLLRRRMLVLAVDGFDELAAEQGTTNALGALALLVRQLEGHGVIVAASRRAFFDTESYLRRSRMFRQVASEACEFDQITLEPWGRDDGIQFLRGIEFDGRGIGRPEQTYNELLEVLQGDADHVMVTRPFLLNHIARGLVIYDTTPADFLQAQSEDMSGVASVVSAFIDREVRDKWRFRETGEPYLSVEQHMVFLAAVAEEMYVAQVERLDLGVVETIATVLLEPWGVDVSRRQEILNMVRMHVLLPPVDGNPGTRHFDHPEFRDYFVALAMKAMLTDAADGAALPQLARFLSVAQISDAVASFAAGLVPLSDSQAVRLAGSLGAIARAERRQTFVQVNCGTLVPFILHGRKSDMEVVIDAPLVFSSIVFENKQLEDVTLRGATFLNVSFLNSTLRHVRFDKCDLGEPTFGKDARYDVAISDCRIAGLRILSEDEEEREYAPSRIRLRLSSLGMRMGVNGESDPPVDDTKRLDGPLYKATQQLLRHFQRTTVVSDATLTMRFHANLSIVVQRVIPLMKTHGILAERAWQGGGKQRIWSLEERLEDVLAAEDGGANDRLVGFWSAVRAGDRVRGD
jgi:hypothetical protein